MNKQAFISLLKNPEKITASDIDGLEEVLLNFPYFQAAHLLNAKGYKDHGKMLAGQKIKKAALYSAERRELKNLLNIKDKTSATPIESVIQDPIKTSIYTIPVNITAQTSPLSDLKIPKEESELINAIKEDTSSSSSEITTEEKEVTTATSTSKESTDTDNNSYKEKLSTKYISDSVRNQFFEELQRNLQSLREMKKRTADEISINKKEEESSIDLPAQNIQNISPPPVSISTPEKLVEQLYEIPATSNRTAEKATELIPEKVKEHNQEEELFTSRLDNVIYSSEKPDRSKAIDEGDLLLGYLSYLETSKKPIAPKQKVNDIIDRFIKQDPSISPLDKNKINEEQLEDKSASSIKPTTKIVSENMAKIFLIQGKKDKAIEIYEQLLLKYPEKKTYFESQIENIKSK